MKELTFRPKIASEILKTGFPMALQQVVVSLGITLIQRAVNQFGQAMSASFTVGHRMETYLTIPVIAFQVTMAAYSGQNIGAGNMKRVRFIFTTVNYPRFTDSGLFPLIQAVFYPEVQ